MRVCSTAVLALTLAASVAAHEAPNAGKMVNGLLIPDGWSVVAFNKGADTSTVVPSPPPPVQQSEQAPSSPLPMPRAPTFTDPVQVSPVQQVVTASAQTASALSSGEEKSPTRYFKGVADAGSPAQWTPEANIPAMPDSALAGTVEIPPGYQAVPADAEAMQPPPMPSAEPVQEEKPKPAHHQHQHPAKAKPKKKAKPVARELHQLPGSYAVKAIVEEGKPPPGELSDAQDRMIAASEDAVEGTASHAAPEQWPDPVTGGKWKAAPFIPVATLNRIVDVDCLEATIKEPGHRCNKDAYSGGPGEHTEKSKKKHEHHEHHVHILGQRRLQR